MCMSCFQLSDVGGHKKEGNLHGLLKYQCRGDVQGIK